MKIPEKYNPDYSERFSLVSFDTCYVPSKNEWYINRLTLKRTTGNGEKISYENIGRVIYAGTPYEKNINDVIDKSGYFVKFRRESLKQKAKCLRDERAKNAFDIRNNSAEIEELQKLIFEKKKEIVAALDNAETAEQVKAACENLSMWRGLPSMFSDFERIKTKENAKTYSSIEQFSREYNELKNMLLGIRV